MPNILIVEDNEGDVFLMKEAFKETNPNRVVEVVKDGDEAISFLTKTDTNDNFEKIALVIVDVNLPKKNGHEVLKFIKQTDYLQHVPVIMLSTSSSINDVLSAYKNYVSSFIVKPIDVDEIYKIVYSIENYWFNVVQLPDNKCQMHG